MNKKGKKRLAFTLIELLAVIIVLAVIALIATPVVLNIIEKVRIGAAESSAKGYATAVEYDLMNKDFNNANSYDGEYDVIDNELNIVYQGTGPTKGFFTVEDKKVNYAELCINGYPIKYENGIGKYSPDAINCEGYKFIEPEGEKCTDLQNYDAITNIKIKTVEDLVCISNLSKNGKTFSGKKVMLLSDIDINDDKSYSNINDTTYGDINGDGTVEGIKVELTTGSGFLPIGTSNSKPFSGVFEGYGYTISNLMINRSIDNVGLFGYINNGEIKGLNIYNVNIVGNQNVGGLVGTLYNGIVNEIAISGNITGTNKVGGVIGYRDDYNCKMTSLYATDVNVLGTYRVGGLVGRTYNYYSGVTLTGVVEKGAITGTEYVGKILGAYSSYYSPSSYSSNLVTSSHSNSIIDGVNYTFGENILSAYDGQLDTWIGGDNDSSGYYFDYDENNKIMVKSVEREPITFTLKGSGTEENPYIINNYQHWKEATARVKDGYYFKLNTDIDFSDKPYYAMGTNGNYFYGILNGNLNTISNVTMNGTPNLGLIGYNNGTIKGLKIENITLNGTNNVGGLVGYNASGTVVGITATNVNVVGSQNVGGLVGNFYNGTVNEIVISGTVTGTSQVGGVIGYRDENNCNMTSLYAKNINVSGNNRIGGLIGRIYNYYKGETLTGVVEKGAITGTEYVGKILGAYYSYYSPSSYSSNLVTSSHSNSIIDGVNYTLAENMLNTYDGQLDTWIGGDNDSSGYYFDYDGNNEIIVKSTEIDPITFTLKGSGTEESPYIINNYQQWKEATTKVKGGYYFKLNTDIDFSDKLYYAMGTNGNYFYGIIDGGYKNISNLTMNGINNIGLIGYNNGGTVKGFNLKNITLNGNENIGAVVGYNDLGTILAINAENINASGNKQVGGLVGQLNSGTINEVTFFGSITGEERIGGVIGQIGNSAANVLSILVHDANVSGTNRIGGIIGYIYNINPYQPTLSGIIETGSISGVERLGKMAGGYYSHVPLPGYASTLFVSPTSSVTLDGNSYSGDDINDLGYYSTLKDRNGNIIIESKYTGDINATGYYFDYGKDGYIKVVPVGGIPDDNPNPPGDDDDDPTPDPEYTVTNVVDGIAPTCEVYYIRPVSNGIQAKFSCTDDIDVPDVRSLFDSTTSKSAATFDTIGTLKNGSVSGTTKTVISTWNVNNPISQPAPGVCYYFRYGGKDSKGNYSTYVTNSCFYGFGE